MWTHAHRFGPLAAALTAALAACADEPQAPTPVPPLFSHGGSHSISGTVLGPDGNSICNSLPAGALVRVRVIDPVNATQAIPFAGAQNLACPNNAYDVPVAPGTYLIRLQIPADPAIVALPFRYLTDEIVVAADVSRDIQVLGGVPLGGLATFEGTPVADVGIGLGYTFPTAAIFAGLDGVSGADGAWDDAPPRSLMAQAGMRYQVGGLGCPFLGARLLNVPPNGDFLFPDEVSEINCTMMTAPAVAFSHDLTRLVVTPMPGDIGGQSGELFGQFGRGWGVQFPVPPPAVPQRAGPNHLFRGGLVMGVAPGTILSGFALDAGPCGAACRDFGLDGTMRLVAHRSGGKEVTWTYSDATSSEGVGLKVVQHSFDGRPPADYVLFQFSISNNGSSTRTLYAGFWGDFDIGDDNDARNDIGFTDLDGRLMYMTNDGDVGVHVGTLLLGDYPVAGNWFRTTGPGTPFTLAQQWDAISGAARNPTTIGPQDSFYLHSLGPITVKPRKSAVIWIAVVAGDDKVQLLANAAAAQADVASR